VRRHRAHAVKEALETFMEESVYRNTGFLRVYIIKFIKRPEILTR